LTRSKNRYNHEELHSKQLYSFYQISNKIRSKAFLSFHKLESILPADIGVSSSFWNSEQIFAKQKENQTDLLVFPREEKSPGGSEKKKA